MIPKHPTLEDDFPVKKTALSLLLSFCLLPAAAIAQVYVSVAPRIIGGSSQQSTASRMGVE